MEQQLPLQAATAEVEPESVMAEAAGAEALQAPVAAEALEVKTAQVNDLFSKLASVFEPANIRKVMDMLASVTMEQIADRFADVVIILYTAFKDMEEMDIEHFVFLAACLLKTQGKFDDPRLRSSELVKSLNDQVNCPKPNFHDTITLYL